MESFKNFFSDKKNVGITVIVILIIFSCIVWLIRMRGQQMQQEQMMIQPFKPVGNGGMPPKMEMGEEKDRNMPYINTKTGTLLDGPGFESGPIDGVNQEIMQNIPSNYYFLDDGANGEMSIQNNLCSKSCCAQQYP
jgi:hypothetical protein